MTARKPAARKATADKPSTTPAAAEPAVEESTAPATVTEQPAELPPAELDDGPAQELAWCRIGRDLEEDAPECPRHEFEPGAELCNLHFVTRLDLRKADRNDD